MTALVWLIVGTVVLWAVVYLAVATLIIRPLEGEDEEPESAEKGMRKW